MRKSEVLALLTEKIFASPWSRPDYVSPITLGGGGGDWFAPKIRRNRKKIVRRQARKKQARLSRRINRWTNI